LDEYTKRMFLMWSKTPEYLDLVTETRLSVYGETRKSKCAVAFSGGKDSTVLLHLVLQVQSDIDVYHWDHGSQLMPRSIEAEILSNAKQLGAKNLIIKTSLAVERGDMRENWHGWYAVFWSSLAKVKAVHGWEIQFVGLRAEEGCKRRSKIRKPTKGECYPLADWGWKDIWAYIVSNNLPYPLLYDVYGPLLGWDKARFVTFFDMEFEKFGSPYLDGFFFPQFRNSIGKPKH
jgi:3'-phosphoadenosine 5'-phosphosulfate sulfotransferase (PAPS reductase)/FAD synthetase